MDVVSPRTRTILPYAALAVLAAALPVLALVLRSGRAEPQASAPVEPRIATPRLPPPGGIVLARESGRLAVVLSARPRARRLALTATVLGPDGGGASGLRVAFRGGGHSVAATACGSGCYEGALAGKSRGVTVVVQRAAVRFELPGRARPARGLVQGVGRALRRARSLVIDERLASSPKTRIVTRFEVAAPDRMTYRIVGGSQAIVIGTRRWDRASPGERWIPSEQSPLSLPAVPWGGNPRDARLVGETGRLWIVTLVDPQIPAWFELRVDKRTLRPAEVRMIAAAHFMRDRYSHYDAPLRIRPPVE
jgi:hypothetical protein